MFPAILKLRKSYSMKAIAIILLFAAAAVGQTAGPVGSAQANQGAPAAINPAQEPGVRKARELIDKMIAALGGQAYLTMQDMEQSGRSYGFSHGEPAGAGSLYWSFWKWPDKDRIELTKQRDVVVIHNGDNGYEITFRGTSAEEQPALEDFLRRRHYSMQEVLRNWLNQPDTALFYEGTSAAERRPAEQVTIMNSKNEAVTFYIDQNTFLPIKKTFVWRDPKTRDRTDESEVYDNYRAVQGIMTPFSVTRRRDDWATNQRFIFAVKYNQNLPDSMFEAQIGAKKTEGKRR
jgi:hypothetical protein